MKILFKTRIFAFILGLLISGVVGVLAYDYVANQISFTPSDTSWKVNNIEDAINDLYSRSQTGGNGYIVGDNKSSILSSLTCTAVDSRSDLVVTITPVFKSGHSEEDIFEYMILVDNQVYARTNSLSATIKDYVSAKEYNIQIIAVDKNIGLHFGTVLNYTAPTDYYVKEVLSRPIITANGIFNVRYNAFPNENKTYYEFDSSVVPTSTDALPNGAYDGDETTFAGPYDITYKYLDVDPSAYGKTITSTTNAVYACYHISEYDYPCVRSKTYSFTIPNGLTNLKVYGNEGLKIYEFKVEQ